MNVIAVTKKGPNKTENEDRIIVGNTILSDGTLISEITNGVIAIADGVGGNNAGSTASHFVANSIRDMKEVSTECFEKINEELIFLSKTNEKQSGMATTLSGIAIIDKAARLFHIGNTRVYLVQSGKYLKQLTTDDTTLNYLLATGQLSPEDASTFDRKNEITACFGGGSSGLFKISVNSIEILSKTIMITSDGIHDYINVDQMEEIICHCGLTIESCRQLINVARNNGSVDDASVILGGVLSGTSF